jgi:hypothetical protein
MVGRESAAKPEGYGIGAPTKDGREWERPALRRRTVSGMLCQLQPIGLPGHPRKSLKPGDCPATQ